MMATFLSTIIRSMLVAAAVATPALAQSPASNPWHGINDVEPLDLAPPPGEIEPVDTSPMPGTPAAEADWGQLNGSQTATARGSLREKRSSLIVGKADPSWNKQDNTGASALSVNRSVTPFWDTRVGADINVARQAAPRSAQDAYRNEFGDGTPLQQSGGSAWAAMTAPGVASIWDQTAIEARIDPGTDQTKLGTSLSKSVPLAGNQYSLTLRSGYNVIQTGSIPAIGFNGRPTRSYETDQQARLDIPDTGTSLMAGQTLATSDDKWLRKIGAEQKLYGGINVTGSVSETVQGIANKSLTAGFKHSW